MTTERIIALRDQEHPPSVYVAAAGAGAATLQRITAVPGISSFFTGASLLYAREELEVFVGGPIDKSCSSSVAISLAIEAYMRAARAGGYDRPAIGIGITAAIASVDPSRGGHRAFLAVVGEGNVQERYLQLGDGTKTGHEPRTYHEHQIADAAIDLLTFDSVDGNVTLSAGTRPIWSPTGRLLLEQLPENCALLAGSFNPKHDGHRGMAAAAAKRGLNPVYALESTPRHKEVLSAAVLLKRIALARDEWPVLLTEGCPLFIDKARLLRSVNRAPRFLAGADTIARMMEPRWYDGTQAGVTAMLDSLATLGTEFFCFERSGAPRIADIVPSRYRHFMFQELDGAWEVSSTALRGAPAAR